MIDTLFGIKKNMTSGYDARGRRVGATIVEVVPNVVTQVKDKDVDGYKAVQLGIGDKKKANKPRQGQLKKAGVEKTVRFLREVRTDKTEGMELGKEIAVNNVFAKGDSVKVSGISKGKGFQGGVRRHGFAGGPKTHGQSDRHRAPGSIGAGTTPGRVLKGKRMAGHMGVDRVSVKGLEILTVDRENNLLFIKGAVPGPTGGLVEIKKLGRIKGYTPPPEEKEDEEEEESSDKKQESREEMNDNSEHSENSVGIENQEKSEEPENSEDSETQNASKPENQNSDPTDVSDQSDASGAPSLSESSDSSDNKEVENAS